MFKENRSKVYEMMESPSLLVMYSGTPPRMHNDLFYPYFPNRNFYYLTGLHEQNQILIYLKSDLITTEFLYTPVLDPAMASVSGHTFDVEAARKISGIEIIDSVDRLEQTLSRAFNVCKVGKVYLDLGMFDSSSAMTEAHLLAQKIRQKASDEVAICNVSDMLAHLRMRKAPEEVESIQKAIDLTEIAIGEMMGAVKPGMNEYELDALLRYTARRNGAEEGFQVIAGGKNAVALHYMDNNTVIEDNTLVVADVGIIWNLYYSDITRTFPANGKFTPRQRELYDIVLKAQRHAISMVKPGITINELTAGTRESLANSCLEIGLIKKSDEISRYWFGGIGHFLGLDCHDAYHTFLIKDLALEEGMVLTIEPGLYLQEEGTGIRIEDDVVVTKNGCDVLSKNIIKDADEIEKFMQAAK
ncbi:MAG: aminopeptidase P N-terminal domain-containing protein [Clostridiales Family XIII bacterium]|jgi:Xaa-Pro aminopeptidase|nr:aminopeptidase P N-terminal domain-containing protein [Clostridiales Family XIII bacterium]